VTPSEPPGRRPFVAEIVGPAGAGKSTLFDLLLEGGHAVRAPRLGRTRRGPLLAGHAVAALGTVVRHRALPVMTPERLLAMAYVQALPAAIRSHGRRHAHLPVLLDQGPVYFLSRPFATAPQLAHWRERWLSVWRERLDVVVSLDAPDDVLAERIRIRPKEHALKQSPDEVAHSTLRAARDAYEDALARLCEDGGVQLLRFDTSAATPEVIAAQVLPGLRRPTGCGTGAAGAR
jgi:adenylate kinase family enzyme